MDTTLLLAGLQFRFLSELELEMVPALKNFQNPSENTDIRIVVNNHWSDATLPGMQLLGEDAICQYYRQEDKLFCITRGGTKGPVACSVYDRQFREIICTLNTAPFLAPAKDLGSVLRMIPLRAIFQHFSVLFLHASRVSFRGKAILFTAPSGTGKTTQAKLWQTYRGADILSNDRTLIRNTDGTWNAYGFPMDGSEPVCSNAVLPLGAVVLLEQGKENRVERMNSAQGAIRLMGQTVIDVWNPEAQATALNQILSLVAHIPLYQLTCTSDKRAVDTLESILLEDEVFSHE